MLTYTTRLYSQNKGLRDRNNSLCSLSLSLSLLRLFSAPPSPAAVTPPPHPLSCSRSLSQEDLKYQYPFLLDIAFSLQSAFCRPFIVKTSGEIPCRNILSNATLPVSRRGRLGRCAAPARLARSSGRGEIRGRTCPGRHNTPGCPYIGVIVPAFQEVQPTKDLTIPKSHAIIKLCNKVPVAYFLQHF